MRHGSSGRRSRNRGNSGRRGGNGGSNRSQVFDSNGPDVRIRGTAHQVFEKYTALAKDAAASGDRIVAESYLQHAEHYQRVINSWAEKNNNRNDRSSDNNQSQDQNQKAKAGEEDLGLPASIVGEKKAKESKKELENA